MNSSKPRLLFHSLIFWASFWFVASAHLALGQENSLEDSSEPVTVNLSISPTILDMEHLKASRMGFVPAGFRLVEKKPAGIAKEPTYRGQVKYGAFRIGNGPRSTTYFAVDEAQGKAGKLYVDLNQNGDLTDDGPGDWEQTRVIDGNNNYITVVPVRASWGTPLQETESGSYSLYVYKRHGAAGGGYAKISGREGKIEIGNKTFHVVLAENTNDGIFTVPAKGDLTRRFVQVYIDLDGDGTFKGVPITIGDKEFKSSERFDLADPFQIGGQWYLAHPTVSGDKLTFTPTDPPGSNVILAQAPTEVKSMLAVGSPAPEFIAQSPEGKPVGLEDFKGKLLIIDFWATTCGPCLTAMPGLERLYQAVKDQDVEVLSLNVLDTKEAFDKWISVNRGTKYNFTFAFDPAGKEKEDSIASSKYYIPVLPSIYVVSRDRKIVGAFAGGGNEEKLINLLTEQGITIKKK